MTPKDRDFLDYKGKKGSSNTIVKGLELPVKLSRSLEEIGEKKLSIEKKLDHFYHIDLSNVVGDKIRVRSRDMQKLARWILNDELQTNVAAKGDSDLSVPRKEIESGRETDDKKDSG